MSDKKQCPLYLNRAGHGGNCFEEECMFWRKGDAHTREGCWYVLSMKAKVHEWEARE